MSIQITPLQDQKVNKIVAHYEHTTIQEGDANFFGKGKNISQEW
ncbi:hypothetical protein [Helicobacter suis]|nr:hypothetical protein [Helicobacter suis]